MPYFQDLLSAVSREPETGLEPAAESIMAEVRRLFGVTLLVAAC